MILNGCKMVFINLKNMFRHVILPTELVKLVPKTHLMTETEWRNLGVQQSPGWVHYMIHAPEPHVILFRRPRTNFVPSSNASSVTSNNVEQPSNPNSSNDVSVHG